MLSGATATLDRLSPSLDKRDRWAPGSLSSSPKAIQDAIAPLLEKAAQRARLPSEGLELLTKAEVMTLTRTKPRSFERHIRPELAAVIVGGRHLYKRADLEEWIDGHRIGPAPRAPRRYARQDQEPMSERAKEILERLSKTATGSALVNEHPHPLTEHPSQSLTFS